jgi:hypothetical protein
MAFFDEEDIIKEVKPTKPKSDFFDEEDVVQASDFFDKEDAPQQTTEPEEGGAFFGKDITEDDIKQVAAKTGADPQFIRDMAPYYGRPLEKEGYTPKVAAGIASEALGGIPTFIAKKLQDDPKARAAMDELNDLAQRKKSYAQAGAEIALGALIPAGAGVKGAAAAGALYGLGESREGRELESAGIGAAGGAAVGYVAPKIAAGIGKLVGKAKDKATQSAIRELEAGPLGREIGQEVEKAVAKDAGRNKMLKEAVLDAPERLANPEAFSKTVPKEELERAAEALSDKDIEKFWVKQGVDSEKLPAYKALSDAQDTVREFGSYVSRPGKEVGERLSLPDAQKAIQERLATEGKEFVEKEFDDYLRSKKALEILPQKLESQLSERSNDFLRIARNFLVDGRFVYRFIDDKLGLQTEKIIDDLSQAQYRYTVILADKMGKGAKAAKAWQKAGGKLDDPTLYEALDTGDFSKLTPEQKQIAEAYQHLFEVEGRLEANKLLGSEVIKKLSAEKAGGYVPRHTVDTPEYIARMSKAQEAVEKSTGVRLEQEITREQLGALRKSAEFGEFKKGLEIMEGRDLNTPEDIMLAVRSYKSPGMVNSKMQTSASAARRREGQIPDFLLEKNVAKLWSNWTQDTFRHAYYRDGLAQLRTARNMALAAGDKASAGYITRHIQDLSGMRQGTLNSAIKSGLQKMQAAALTKLKDPNISGPAKAFNSVLAETPELMGTIMNQVYPNFLGLSPRAAIVNLTQPLYMTVPELGGYGMTKILQAAKTSAKSGFGMTKASREALRQKGLLGAQWNTELRDALKGGIDSTGLYGMGRKALDKYTDAAMFMFEKSEALNRQITSDLGVLVAKDLMEGSSKGAQKFLENAGSGYRRAVQQAIKQGNAEEVERLTQNYLIGKTMFHYNRASMSEFGRFMGPFFSVFTKWPSSIAGDVLQIMTREGKLPPKLMRAGGKYMMPWGLAVSADYALTPEDGATPVQERLLGKQGLAGAAPIGNVKNILQGSFGKPPVVAAVTDLPVAVLERDPEKAWKWFNSTVNAFAPGAGLVRFLTDDLPTFVEGERPQGTFLGKAAKAVGIEDLDTTLTSEK